MNVKRIIPIVVVLLALAMAWFFWPVKHSPGSVTTTERNSEKTDMQPEKIKEAPEEKEVSQAENNTFPVTKDYSFVLQATQTTNVYFALSGKMENPNNLSAGDHFNKNDLLFQLDNSSLFNEISRKKTELKSRLEKLYEQFFRETPEAYDKWKAYGDAITETDLLAPLPETMSAKERSLVNSGGIVVLSQQIQQQEQEIFSYFYLAPFDGSIQKIIVKTGKQIKAQQAVAVIYRDETVLLERKIHKKDIPVFTQSGKLYLKGKNNKSKQFTLHFKTGRYEGDSVTITAVLPYKKLEIFDFFETVKITPN